MSETSDKIEERYKEIDVELMPIKSGESVAERFTKSSALVFGYNQHDPIARALGFQRGYDIQQSLHRVSHLITASDVETVVKWLLNSGYDIIKK